MRRKLLILSILIYFLNLAIVTEYYVIFLILLLGTLILLRDNKVLLIMLVLIILISGYVIKSKEINELDCYHFEGTIISKSVIFNDEYYFVDYENNRKYLLGYLENEIIDGSYIEINGYLEKIENTGVIGSFSEKSYYNGKNIFYKLNIKNIVNIENKESLKYKLLLKIYLIFQKHYGDTANVIFSMIFGIKKAMSRELLFSFSMFGLTHLLVVSGLHVSIIFDEFDKIFKKMRFPYYPRKTILISMLLALMYLSNFNLSTIRAVSQKIIKFIGNIKNVQYDSLSALSLINIILLIYNPYYTLSISYQLSFLAAFSLAQIKGLLGIYRVYIGIFPLLLTLNPQFNFLSIPINIFMIYIMSFFLPITIIFSFIPFNIPIIHQIIKYWYKAIETIIVWASKIQIFNIALIKPNEAILCVYYFAFFVWFIGKENEEIYGISKKLRYYLIVVVFCGMLTINSVSKNFIKNTISFIDVANGDAALIITDKGNTVLIDAGYNSSASSYLDYIGIKSIDIAIISHGHKDHYGGLEYFENKPIKLLLTNADEVLNLEKLLYTKYSGLEKLDVVKLDNINLIVLSPDADLSTKDENDKSIVVDLNILGVNVLFTGDISSKIEKTLDISSVDILKVAHHGSKTSSSESFLEMARPLISVVSVGENNIYGHPNEGVLERLKEYSGFVFLTKENGTILFKIFGSKIKYKYM